MALLDSEIARIRAELGVPSTTVNAEPYIGFVSLFTQVIQPYTQAGASTTSATAVTAATSPTPVTLTLTSATGFASGARVIIDVDERQESAIVSNLSGASMTVLLTKAHSGTYPVTVEGGESIIREILRKLWDISKPGGKLESAMSAGGIKKVDEIEFFGDANSSGGGAQFKALIAQREYFRAELARNIGYPYRGGPTGGGGMSSLC